MAKKVNGLSFGVDPKGEATKVNPNQPGAMDAVLAPAPTKSSTAETTALNHVSPQQLAEVENDSELATMLEETGTTASEYVNEVQASLPRSAGNLGDVLKEGNSVKDTYEATKRLKKNVSSNVYNDIEADTLALTTKMSKKITNEERPLGDYFCRLDSSKISSLVTDGLSDFAFDLDKAIKAALAGALAAVGVNNKCGFDSVEFLKDSVGNGLLDKGMEQAVAVGVMDEAAAKGTASAVADLAVVYGDDMSTGSKLKTAHKLAKNYVPGVSTAEDGTGDFTDGLKELVPGFSKPNSKERNNLMRDMQPGTLDELSKDKEYRADALAAKGTKSDKSFFEKMKDQYDSLVA